MKDEDFITPDSLKNLIEEVFGKVENQEFWEQYVSIIIASRESRKRTVSETRKYLIGIKNRANEHAEQKTNI